VTLSKGLFYEQMNEVATTGSSDTQLEKEKQLKKVKDVPVRYPAFHGSICSSRLLRGTTP
jgi:hypothetical protein